MMLRSFLVTLSAVVVTGSGLFFYSSAVDLPADVQKAYDALPPTVDYNIDVKPILSNKCFACHGPDKNKQKAGLRLDIAANAYAEIPDDIGVVAIKPGDLQHSEVVKRILSTDSTYLMPAPESHHTLSAYEKAVIIKWIKNGAVYKPHWAFVKPVKTVVPVVDGVVNNPIDNFVLARLKRQNLLPSKEADKELLLRRLSLDLTGLPPTLKEIDDYLKDSSPNAYEKQVDRLLASPHYGEKMAVDWLDAARFADSHGYTVDRIRDMSPYRDWVIKAFNSNFSYDKFIQWQLAGDLMPHPTKDMIIATAFNRNHQQNMEGGVVEEEYQTEYVIDRTNTFGSAVLGMTVGCAKCHDHKFDPISQKNYYQLFSFFNNVKEAGQISWDDALPTPTLMLPTAQKEKILAFINDNIAQQKNTIAQTESKALADFDKWLANGEYKKLATEKIPANGLQASFNFDKGDLASSVNPKYIGTMKREGGQAGDAPLIEAKGDGKALALNGDTWLDLNKIGVFRKSQPFSIGIWVNIPKQLGEGVIFHKGNSERLYNFRGYHLYLKNNKLELNMAHTGPSNAITLVTVDDVPRDKWIQLTATYDGSAKADGFKLYLDGSEMKMETTMDQLTKDILFMGDSQPGLQVGAWERGRGFKDGKVDDIVVYNRTLTAFEVKILAQKDSWQQVAAKNKEALSADDIGKLKAYYLTAVAPLMLAETKKLTALRTTLSDSTENVAELMVMQEMAKPKNSYLLNRGNYDMPGEQVFPNTPEAILPFAAGLPKNRYGLAQWATNADNPLVARVAVNRLWQNFFGTGLVKTSEDFGNQGEMPSHPELLDWLATTFVEQGWDMKALNKLIVMSATYRQDSRPAKEAAEKDPENRYLSHGPAYRMPAEMIRDNALFASGLLNTQIGGKSIKPYQPAGLWEINNTTYTPDTGKAVYRRSLYVIVKRSVPNPTLATFDAPSRSYCIIRRQKTNTPLQALVTLNDPTFVEAAKVLGEQMTRNTDGKAAITTAYRKLTSRSPTADEVSLLMALQQVELKKFKTHPEKQKGWLTAGQYRVDKKLDGALIAANTVVASAILNSDASLTKR
ncbi:DUF1553 domain-containing protein [Mucilaginibacter ginsenosidivorax]|uniref:DUF1553 domain-containing protein n=1 Tax=Mucilaginibacter ginsenosidivorax TaxID=862126 RepID=A0A5B8VWQ4_9SPHI|nr:DUF1553 domain-containing protein [Mucilaginibacter ginsenosidivorax]QEC74866.1 DUF1553 domain-containing protein [Mucilaginibacter ginsenosidivorax]